MIEINEHVTLVDHPLVQHKLSILRDKSPVSSARPYRALIVVDFPAPLLPR